MPAMASGHDGASSTALHRRSNASFTGPSGRPPGNMSSRLRKPVMIVPVLLSSSLIFFAVTNFAVWAFSPMYPANATGLLKCYIAALPFLQNMLCGDLFWGIVLFGGHWLAQNARAGIATVAAPLAPR